MRITGSLWLVGADSTHRHFFPFLSLYKSSSEDISARAMTFTTYVVHAEPHSHHFSLK